MRIFIKAKPSAREEKIEKLDSEHYIISVRERPENNEANIAIIKALAEYFGISMLKVRLISGRTSRQKIFVIN
jgi:uncharacterized protein YggU (UPF0235/DUF167 family)